MKFIEATTSGKDIVLDAFAGSGSTAHAVLALNNLDEGQRRFVLIQLPEEIKKETPAYAAGFRDVIDITLQRVSRVIKGVPKASDAILKKGLGGSFSYFELGKHIELDGILDGKNLPSYMELARYVFYTATGQEFDEKKVDEKKSFIGSTKEYDVYLFYKPDVEFLKGTALTLERARTLPSHKEKRRLVFAPTKYLDQDQLAEFHIDFAQLPFEIYRHAE
jgi:adenine-specific DNA-methyltransferase